MLQFKNHAAWLVSVLLSAACAEGTDAAEPADPDGGTNTDSDDLLACDVEEPCSPGSATRWDSQPRQLNAGNVTCILRGLEDRTPGLCVHKTENSHGSGSDSADHVLLVRADGKVRYVRSTINNLKAAARRTPAARGGGASRRRPTARAGLGLSCVG